jgi:hypothetical protein
MRGVAVGGSAVRSAAEMRRGCEGGTGIKVASCVWWTRTTKRVLNTDKIISTPGYHGNKCYTSRTRPQNYADHTSQKAKIQH